MEIIIVFLCGFSLGWASVWTIFSLGELKAIDQESLEYNNGGGKTLVDYINSKFDPENYLGKGK